MRRLSIKQIISLHTNLIEVTGGLDGIRDMELLESAINAPFGTFGGVNLYPTIESRASRLAFGIIKNHPFIDGNKRIGVLVMLVFLELNGIPLVYTDDELVEIGLALAEGNMDEKQLLTWIIKHN